MCRPEYHAIPAARLCATLGAKPFVGDSEGVSVRWLILKRIRSPLLFIRPADSQVQTAPGGPCSLGAVPPRVLAFQLCRGSQWFVGADACSCLQSTQTAAVSDLAARVALGGGSATQVGAAESEARVAATLLCFQKVSTGRLRPRWHLCFIKDIYFMI